MEGTLQVPPDRGTIIGRASWKSRYVVVGGAQRESQRSASSSQSTTNPAPQGWPEAWYLSIYKSKEEWEPIQQHAVSLITDAQVQMVAHRKQGPVLPTLVVVVAPDPAVDKLRKRRSSRTAGLTSSSSSSKEVPPTTLWFRLGSDGPYTLHDWARLLQQLIQPNLPGRVPMSPITPASPTFMNPFMSRPREVSEVHRSPSNGKSSSRAALKNKISNQIHSSRERDRPIALTESLSLRSKRSDISSQTSSVMNNLHSGATGFQNFSSVYPADLPSPAATIGDHQDDFIEGWTSAQGRSSTLSSPTRIRDSYGPQVAAPAQPMVESSSPPGPRETILDRAFQLHYIPGAEFGIPGEEKLSSLARFDALMREADENRRRREQEEARSRAASAPGDKGLKSALDPDDDEDSDAKREANDNEYDDDDDDDDDDSDEVDVLEDPEIQFIMPSPARRALNFIAARHGAEPTSRMRSQTIYDQQSQNSGSSQLRPQTGYSNRNRPAMAQRTHSQPQLAIKPAMLATLAASAHLNAAAGTAPPPLPLPPYHRGVSAGGTAAAAAAADEYDGVFVAPTTLSGSIGGSYMASLLHSNSAGADKPLSASSIKRLSFTELTKRLSSTSSLLLAQGNNSATGSDVDASSLYSQSLQQQSQPLSPFPRPPLQPCGAPPQSPHVLSEQDCETWEKRRSCRGGVGVGVFSAVGEGGFL